MIRIKSVDYAYKKMWLIKSLDEELTDSTGLTMFFNNYISKIFFQNNVLTIGTI